MHPRSITVAEGRNVVLSCKATGEGILHYQWTRISGSLPEIFLKNTVMNLTISNITVNDSGKYYCKVDNGGMSVSSLGAQVIVKSTTKCNQS